MALIENLSNDDEGSEYVAKKRNMCPFKLFCVNLDPFNFSNVDDFFWSWILKEFIQVRKERKIHHRMFACPPWSVASGGSRRIPAVDVKEMYSLTEHKVI